MVKDGIIGKVKIRMDELTPFEDGLCDSVSNPINSYISECMPSAWVSIINRCPLGLLPITIVPASPIVINTDLSVNISYDEKSFIRIYSVRMKSWNKDVTDFITTDSPIWKEQQNKYTRGTIYKPIAVKMGDDTIKLFSAKDNLDTLDNTMGVMSFENISFETCPIMKRLEEAYYCEVAGLVYAIMEQKQKEEMFAMANKFLGI